MFNKKIILDDGTIYEGYSFGAKGNVEGEIVINTSISDYQSPLTDTAYENKIVLFTYPLIGNTGVNSSDFKGKKKTLSAMIVKELCEKPSNFTVEFTLDEALKEMGIIGICGVDTRSLTRKLRGKEKIKITIMDM